MFLCLIETAEGKELMPATTYLPPEWAVWDDTERIPKLMHLFQRVSKDITGKTRWLGSPEQVRKGEGRYRNVFKELIGNLRQWDFDPEQYLRWVIEKFPSVLRSPRLLNQELELSAFREHRIKNLGVAVAEDRVIRGKLDLINAGMVSDVEMLASWQNFMPGYTDRLLNLQHALSPHFLATDTEFLKLIERGLVKPEHVARVQGALAEYKDTHFYQQVRRSRDAAIAMVAGK